MTGKQNSDFRLLLFLKQSIRLTKDAFITVNSVLVLFKDFIIYSCDA